VSLGSLVHTIIHTDLSPSASAPTFAAIVADLNSIRLAANKSTLGFLNPWIYGLSGQGFTDIIHGGSTGCKGEDPLSGEKMPYVPYASWNATVGWDPVTGMGTPLFEALASLVTSI
jgi:tripeptidyl-peptidase I